MGANNKSLNKCTSSKTDLPTNVGTVAWLLIEVHDMESTLLIPVANLYHTKYRELAPRILRRIM